VAATGLVPTIRVNLLLRERGNVARRAVSGDNSCSHPIGPHPLVPIYFHQSPRDLCAMSRARRALFPCKRCPFGLCCLMLRRNGLAARRPP
jgi:hypothetical protein